MAWQIGVDVGGTFTDLLALDPEHSVFRVAKVLSTPEDQSVGFIAGLAVLDTDRTAVADARTDSREPPSGSQSASTRCRRGAITGRWNSNGSCRCDWQDPLRDWRFLCRGALQQNLLVSACRGRPS